MHRKDGFGEHAPRADLGGLPVFAPPATLWPRIAAAQALRERKARQRRLAVGGGIGTAAAAALFAVAALLLPQRAPTPQAVADDQRESRTLESQWRQLAGSASPAPAGLSRLRLIDATLQSAYDRGARADELAPLWRQRNEALRGLITQFQASGVHEASAITRI